MIRLVRSRDCCGNAYGVGFELDGFKLARRHYTLMRIKLWWFHIVIRFRKG